uniref:Ovule protein n=1 Tax=Caenorhabditis tropicalis TaxID=1561998 RepID=A0A1I7TM68_9PELO
MTFIAGLGKPKQKKKQTVRFLNENDNDVLVCVKSKCKQGASTLTTFSSSGGVYSPPPPSSSKDAQFPSRFVLFFPTIPIIISLFSPKSNGFSEAIGI